MKWAVKCKNCNFAFGNTYNFVYDAYDADATIQKNIHKKQQRNYIINHDVSKIITQIWIICTRSSIYFSAKIIVILKKKFNCTAVIIVNT